MKAMAEAESEAVARGRRETQRARLHLNAVLATTAQDYPVVLRNLSCTGAMVQLDTPLPAGRTVALRRGVLDELATIVWSRGGFCGLEFFDPIALDTVLELAAGPVELPAARASAYPLAGGDDRLSEEEWQAAKEAARRRLARDR